MESTVVTTTEVLLNNPVWSALAHQQSGIALGTELARRFPSDMGPFAAVASAEPAAYAQLAALIQSGEGVALVGMEPPTDANWLLLRQITLLQMVYTGAPIAAADVSGITPLSSADVPAMRELVDLTHPGPFEQRTIELGSYFGIWQEGRLAAMAGERMHLPGYREISAVCTHPDFGRRGLARRLVLHLMSRIQTVGEVPILHVFNENAGALALYESIGFHARAELTLSVLKRQ